MREIKFRAWDYERKIMETNIQSEYEGKFTCFGSYLMSVNHHEVMQYTGLKDKNDVEIYEGDIIKALNRNYDCEEKREEYFKKFLVDELKGCFMFSSWNAHEFFNKFMYIEVLGNIYENPQLLEDK